MANPKGNPKNLKTPWKRGQSGNPGGRDPLPEEIREARKLNREELERELNLLIYMTRSELKKASEDPNASSMRVLLISILGNAMKTGDHVRASFIFDRLVGKPKEKVEIESNQPLTHATIFGLIRQLETGKSEQEALDEAR